MMKRFRLAVITCLTAVALLAFGPVAQADTYQWSGWVECDYDSGGYTNIHWQIDNNGTSRRVRLFGWGNNSLDPATGFGLYEKNDLNNATVGGIYSQNGKTQLYTYQTGDLGSTLGWLRNNIPGTLYVVLLSNRGGTETSVCGYHHTF